MNTKRRILFLPAIAALLLAGACKSEQTFDASGAFEAEETVISSQAQGVILRLDVEEGDVLDSGAEVGCVDTTDLSLTREQLLARIEALTARKPETVRGTVLTKYARANEVTAPGQPLYRIADLSHMTLRVYISGQQLPEVRIGKRVSVYTDAGGKGGDMHRAEGTVTWISDRAEFTPKTIQTRDERADLVYAVKVRVPNPDGRYKMGMYGEITFD